MDSLPSFDIIHITWFGTPIIILFNELYVMLSCQTIATIGIFSVECVSSFVMDSIHIG